MADIKPPTPRKLTLAEKIRRAREFKHEVGGFTFTLRRPTECEWYDTVVGTGSTARFLPFIIGWDGVREMDILPNADPHPMPFDEITRDEWLSDRSDLFGPLVSAIFDAFNAYREAREPTEKKS